MDEIAAQKLIRETLEAPFDKDRFVYLVKNILNHVDDAPFTYQGKYIFDGFADAIKLLERVGKYSDPSDSDKRIDILIVHLKRATSLERARTMQRNFVAKYLNGSHGGELKDAALVAFVAPNPEDWRFSFVKMEYGFDETGKIKEELTPARRCSFLVGTNEHSHTAQTCLLPVLRDDEADPTLKDLEDIFSVERVTKEFFEKYRDLFLDLKDALGAIVKRDAEVKADFEAKGVTTIDFAKKLLGQIVFLYFLQKKGWFGVARGEAWGDGSKHFLRELFENEHGDYENFFNDILEPLFYEALRLERPGDYYSRFDCRIPFLNGGLFDPLRDYDWVNTDILIPNELFSNAHKTKEGDSGNGVLDVFDRYNFTVKEDEPLEKEVAVDPEMLGKVFENLLEIKDRKSKGTYYTPREIVHYMCRESLTHYLAAELDGRVKKDDIETLIKYGEAVVENDSRVIDKGRETQRYAFRLPQGVRDHAALIDAKLAALRVCDPAVGSGAFVVGMMNEVVRTRNALATYLDDAQERTPYHLKRHAIQNCLYGVDIEPSAVEIAKLRLWLSLIVDEEKREAIQPLPNLDYKIVQGNALLGVEKDLFNNRLVRELERLKPLYFNENSVSKKENYKNQIDDLIGQITKGRTEFDFEVYFSEVFHEKKGFDVVIANPPYISHDKIPKQIKAAIQEHYQSYQPFADVYCYFIEKAIELQNEGGILSFITSNSYLRAEYGAPIRKLLRTKNMLLRVLSIEGSQVFESAIVNVAITVSRKPTNLADDFCIVVNSPFSGNRFEDFVKSNGFNYPQSYFNLKSWTLIEPQLVELQRKLESSGKTLEQLGTKIRLGIATGSNAAFLIDERKKQEFSKKNAVNTEIIKPILRGRDISRYSYTLSGQYIFLAKNGVEIKKDYPDIYEHLASFGDKFRNRGAQGQHWTNLRACSFYDDFKKEKIVWIELTDLGRFALCNEEIYLLNSAYFLLPPSDMNSKFLLGILNSSTIRFYLHLVAETSGMGINRWINNYVKEFPIPTATPEQQDSIIRLVNRILKAKADDPNADTGKLEGEIDRLVYQLYGLTEEEVETV